MRLSDEALRYFEQAGDDGDKVYVAALRERIGDLESVNADLYEALSDFVQWFNTPGVEAFPEDIITRSIAALAKARGEE